MVTSDVRFAGTAADVYVELHGATGCSGALHLENAAANFERGRRDVFTVAAPDVGAVEAIDVWHTNNGRSGSAWHLQDVEVRP